MHFGVCFFCIIFAFSSFVTAMQRPFLRERNELKRFINSRTQEIERKGSEGFFINPRALSHKQRTRESFPNKGHEDSLIKILEIMNNAGNSPTYGNHGVSNEIVRNDSDSISVSSTESLKSGLWSQLKPTGKRKVRKMEDYSDDYDDTLLQYRRTNNLIAPVNTLREADGPLESSSVANPLSGVKHDARGNDLDPSTGQLQLLNDNLRKSAQKAENVLKERKWGVRQRRTPEDEVSSGYTPQRTSLFNYQKKDEQHNSDEGEQKETSLHRKQRNAGVFWPTLGDTSRMLGEPEDPSHLQNDLLHASESSTQYFFAPNSRDILFRTADNTFPGRGNINSPDVNEDDKYLPKPQFNSIQDSIEGQNYLQDGQPFSSLRSHDHNYQPLSSLADTANKLPSNKYMAGNSYLSESVPILRAQSSDYHASSSNFSAPYLNKYLTNNNNNNIAYNSQKVLPHIEQINYLSGNRDEVSKNKFAYNGRMSNILNQNAGGIYPGQFIQSSYVGDNIIAPDSSDSFPSENKGDQRQIAYKNTEQFLNNLDDEPYLSNGESPEEYVEGGNNVGNDEGYNSDTGLANAMGERYPYAYLGSLKEISNKENYIGVPLKLQHNPNVKEIETRDSYEFLPISPSKRDHLSPRFNRHFTSHENSAMMGSDIPRKWQHKFQKNKRKNVFKRYKTPFSGTRQLQVSPYSQYDEYNDLQPRQNRIQDSMSDFDYTDYDSGYSHQRNAKDELKVQNSSQTPHSVVTDSQNGLQTYCIEETTASDNVSQAVTGKPEPSSTENGYELNNNGSVQLETVCIEEPTTNAPPVTTLVSSTKSTTALIQGLKKTDKSHKKRKCFKSEANCKTDFPCSVSGSWYSEIGGILLSLKISNGSKLDVEILDTPSYYKGNGILSKSWKISGEIPFYPKMQSFINLKGFEYSEHKFSTFIGECFTCESEDVIYGSWILGRPAHSCKDQHISTTEHKDIFRKTNLQNLSKENFHTPKEKPAGH